MRMRTIAVTVCDAIPTQLAATRTLPRASGGSSASSSDQDAGKPMIQPQRAAAPPPSLLQITGMPPVMTSTRNRARHELIQLPTISVKVRLLGTRLQSGTVPGDGPRLPGGGDAPPSESAFSPQESPSPICPESGTLPRSRPRFVGDGDAPPSPIPIGGPTGGLVRAPGGIRLRVPPSP